MPSSDLIYDVGMNNGDDTAYYLHRGFRVVAIEANPDIVRSCEARFRREIAEERLTILNVAIGPQPGVAKFWIYLDRPEWSSFSPGRAIACGLRTKVVDVRVRNFGNILQEFGIPHYLKIDIQGCDIHCLQELSRNAGPTFVSVELTKLEEILALRDLGYDQYKIVLQGHHRALPDQTRSLVGWWNRLISSAPLTSRAAAKLGRLADRIRRGSHRFFQRLGLAKPADWQFPHGSSGPFGEEAPGEWLSFNDACLRWLDFRRVYAETLWCDVHATKSCESEAAGLRQAA
jgi:FkbM family methyltransferase